jgi:hypothetical protein
LEAEGKLLCGRHEITDIECKFYRNITRWVQTLYYNWRRWKCRWLSQDNVLRSLESHVFMNISADVLKTFISAKDV